MRTCSVNSSLEICTVELCTRVIVKSDFSCVMVRKIYLFKVILVGAPLLCAFWYASENSWTFVSGTQIIESESRSLRLDRW